MAAPPPARPGAGAWIAGVLLPPLGVYLQRGIGPGFWTTAGLTLVGWVPGIAFAYAALARPGLLAGR